MCVQIHSLKATSSHLKCSTVRVCYDFIHPDPRDAAFWYSPLTMCLCLMRNFSSLPTHPSFIFLYLQPPSSSPNSPSASDEPGQLKIYLPKKLLECLPKCSSLPKERHRWNTNEVRMRHTQEGNIRDSETHSVFFTGDSSLANVTLRDEGKVNKHNGSFSLWDPKNCDTKK